MRVEIAGNPTILANEQGEFVILENIRDMSTVESYARALTIKMGGVVFLPVMPECDYCKKSRGARLPHVCAEPGPKNIDCPKKSKFPICHIACESLKASIYKHT